MVDVMAYIIRTPAPEQTYSLTSDLKIMADDIIKHLNTITLELAGMAKINTNVVFKNVTGDIGSFLQLFVRGSLANSSVKNTGGFGLQSGGLVFHTTDQLSWSSNGHINVPGSPTGTQAVNWNTHYADVLAVNQRIDNLVWRVDALDASYATDADIAALWGAVSSKANHMGDVNLVNNSIHHQGRQIAVGAFYRDVRPLESAEQWWDFGGQHFNHTPVVFAMARDDTGHVSIICSVNEVTQDGARIKFRNLNPNEGDKVWIQLLAI
jgi:hypothetical protein